MINKWSSHFSSPYSSLDESWRVARIPKNRKLTDAYWRIGSYVYVCTYALTQVRLSAVQWETSLVSFLPVSTLVVPLCVGLIINFLMFISENRDKNVNIFSCRKLGVAWDLWWRVESYTLMSNYRLWISFFNNK